MAAWEKYNNGCVYSVVPAAGPWLGFVTAARKSVKSAYRAERNDIIPL